MSKVSILTYVIFAIPVGYFWHTRNRSFLLGFFLSIIFSPLLGFIIAFVLPYDKNKIVEMRKIPVFHMILALGFSVLVYFIFANINCSKNMQPTEKKEIEFASAIARYSSTEKISSVIKRVCEDHGYAVNVIIEESPQDPGVYAVGIFSSVKPPDSNEFIKACVKGIATGLRKEPLDVEIISINDYSKTHFWLIEPQVCLEAFPKEGIYNPDVVNRNIQKVTEDDFK